jgi:hypothetical protein
MSSHGVHVLQATYPVGQRTVPRFVFRLLLIGPLRQTWCQTLVAKMPVFHISMHDEDFFLDTVVAIIFADEEP